MNDMALRDNFRANVKKRRMELGLTQQEVADRLGVTRPQIAQVEAGISVPGLDLVERFARALDCPSVSLLVIDQDAIVAS